MDDKFLKKIRKNVKFHSGFANQIAERVRPTIVAMESLNKQMRPIINKISIEFNIWLKENRHNFEAINSYAKKAKHWQNNQKQNVVVMAESGWFPNWFTFSYEPEVETTDIDILMSAHLDDCWEDLTNKIIEICPNRRHILDTAFSLHKEGNYIASIPLFLSQADGVFCEEIKTFLFTGDKPKDVLENMLESGKLQKGFFEDILLEPYKVKTQFSEGIRKSSDIHKKKAPNRNGILHGHRKHLDYGSKINSLKSFSLLAFVVFSVKDTFKQT